MKEKYPIVATLAVIAFIILWIYVPRDYNPCARKPCRENASLSTPSFPLPLSDRTVQFVTPSTPGLYTIKEYGIEFEYPEEYLISPYPVSYPAMVNIKAKDTLEYQWLFGMSVDMNLPGYDPERGSLYPWPSTNTFRDLAEFVAKQWCLADGHTGSTSCDEVISITHFFTKGGIPGYELYLHQITTDYIESKTIAEQIRGPIFVLDMKEATNGRLTDVRWELAEFAKKKENVALYEPVLREVVSSLRTIQN